MADSKDKYLTLPLLERPRPTWSMPSDEDDVPGRKFYVHHNGWEKVKQDSRGNKTSKTENNRSVEPLDKDNLFEFDLFFENLKEWELGLLLYSLELQNGMAHKLGMAKAFGFGSVKIDADNILLKKSPNQNLHEANCDEDTGEMEKSEIKWQDATNGKGCWLQKGFDVLGSWFDENWEQVEPANDIKEIKEIKIPGVEHIKGLRSLLQIPEELDKAKVRYPALETKDDSEKLPGYVELDDEDEEGGREYLKRPWQPWYPMLKRSTKEGATKRSSKDTKKHPENSTEKGTTGNFGKIIFPKEISRALKSSTEEKITGRVKWFNHQKEYGFIECDNRGDVFVHKSGIKDYHRDIDYKGKDVKFSVTQGEKGPNACNVELIEQEEM